MKKYPKNRHYYTDEEIAFLAENVKDIPLDELTKKFNERFNLNVSVKAISHQKFKHGLKSDINYSHFKKGATPWNKGKSICLSPKTAYKKGNVPYKTRPIGAERVNRDGFVVVKIANPRTWRLKHHVIYEKSTGIKIGRWDKVIFLDGNNRNFDINNLALLSNSEQSAFKSLHLQTNIPELTKTGVLISKVRSAMKAKKSRG